MRFLCIGSQSCVNETVSGFIGLPLVALGLLLMYWFAVSAFGVLGVAILSTPAWVYRLLTGTARPSDNPRQWSRRDIFNGLAGIAYLPIGWHLVPIYWEFVGAMF